MAGNEKRINCKSKDSVFCDIFSRPEYLIQLYRTLHPEDTDSTEADLTGVTLKTVLSEGIYNDLGFQVKDKLLILVEAQSTWSPSIVIRSMIYMMQTLQEYFNNHNINLYKNNHIKFPKPELYVIYNKKRTDQKEYISFKEEYFKNEECCIEVKVKMIYLDDSNSIINQYIKFCLVLDDQIKLYGRDIKAIEETIRICKESDILAEYLKSREVEVKDIMHTLFDQDRINELNRLEAVEKAAKKAAEKEAANSIRKMMKNLKLSAEAAMEALEIPKCDYPKYMAML